MKLQCRLFGHKWLVHQHWVPSMNAKIVTEVWDEKLCSRCELRERHKWYDRKDYIKKMKI